MWRALAPGIPPVTLFILNFKHAITYPRGFCSTGAKPVERNIALNERGEEILFKGQHPPKGYTYFRNKSRRRPGGQYGLYVPSSILYTVIAQNRLRLKIHNEKLTQWFQKNYPHMPLKDMARIQKISPFAKTSKFKLVQNIAAYVLSQHTAFDSFRSDDEKCSMARGEADKIVETWRGE
ncbi:hypothetical protein E4U17_004884 [Claviceps sp. LM77 group G4]|nr:hypothetical protein E4U17_004884 [Claviceps sp. LM77 group G4]